MKRVLLGCLLAVCASVPAQARVHTIAPPGNSGVGQYVETVPTAGGGRPTNTVHPVAGGSHSSGGGSGGSTSAGGSLSGSTQHALAAQGPDGAAAASLAQATAPSRTRPAAPAPPRARSSAASTSTSNGASPLSTLFKGLSGSTSTGFGPAVPIILIGTLLGACALVLLRRRRAS